VIVGIDDALLIGNKENNRIRNDKLIFFYNILIENDSLKEIEEIFELS